MFVKGGDLSMKDMRIAAGKGARGKDGVLDHYDFLGQQQADPDGKRAVHGTVRGPEKAVTCAGGAKTKGGAGGDKGSAEMPGTPGPANGGLLSNCTSIVDGLAGASASKAAGERRNDATSVASSRTSAHEYRHRPSARAHRDRHPPGVRPAYTFAACGQRGVPAVARGVVYAAS